MRVKPILYLSYNGALEPIFQSQGLPYLKGLAKRKTQVVLLTFEKKEDLRRTDPRDLEAIRNRLAGEEILWYWSRYHKWPPLLSTMWDASIGFIRAWRLARKYRVGLIHARGSIPASFGWPVSRILNKPFLFDMRGFLAEEYADGGIWKRGGVIFHLVSGLERQFLRSSASVVVLTERASAYLRQERLCPAEIPVTVIPCCVDLERFQRNNGQAATRSKEGFVLTYVGSLGTWYLLEQMLDFYRALKQRVPHASFQIVTQTRDRTLRNQLQRRGILVQEVPYDELPERITSARAGISFIKPAFSKMASSPVKVGEYLAAGLPVVLNPNVGDTETLIKDNRVGVVVSEFKESCYEKAIEELLDLLKEGEALSKRCQRVASAQLSLEEGARRYQEIYESLLKGVS